VLFPEFLLFELLEEDDELDEEEPEEATEVLCLGVSTFIFDNCCPK
jgi:hypothetical protein